jgi:hypothetical protein
MLGQHNNKNKKIRIGYSWKTHDFVPRIWGSKLEEIEPFYHSEIKGTTQEIGDLLSLMLNMRSDCNFYNYLGT